MSQWFEESLCMTWSRGVSLERVAAIFGSGIDTGRRLDFIDATIQGFEAREIAGEACTAIVGELGEWVVTIEPDGYRGSDVEIWSALSADDQAIAFLCGFNVYKLDYVVASERVTNLSLWDSVHRSGIDPHRLDPFLHDLSLDDEFSVKVSALTICERLTGERLDSEWLTKKHRWLLWEDLDSFSP
ncbi:DUF6461 domain-containing protein [Streptosporangium sp. V21-05]|uniref:DUF6461 domain-containing protein n=1 Tax=Streptosporangium sp. V21-05 TaxID=3446115 RepID=UPI003F52FADC